MYDVAKVSRIGSRQVNQDFALSLADETGAYLVVCDGLGAYSDSDRASRISAHIIAQAVAQKESLTALYLGDVFKRAHDEIVRAKERGEISPSSCSTASFCYLSQDSVCTAHCGDTRVYIFRQGRISFVTKDHSLAQIAVDKGKINRADIADHKDQNKLTRVLGGKFFILPDTHFEQPLTVGDGVLVCSDGWWSALSEAEILRAFSSCVSAEDGLRRMEEIINGKAGDNYTALLAIIK